jgi:hypothetical protein
VKEFKSIVGMCLLAVHEKGEDAIRMICNCHIPSTILLMEYNKLEKKLEDLDDEQKDSMWNEVYKMFPHRDQTERLRVCKIIHTIGELL